MPVLDARQMIWQRLTTGALTRRAGHLRLAGRCGLGLFPGQFGLGGGDIAGQRLLEQIACFGREGFAARAKAHPAQVRELQREGFDLDPGGVKLGVAAGDLFAQPKRFGFFFLCLVDELLNGAEYPIRQCGRGIQAGQFSVQIHADIILCNRPKSRMHRAFQRYLPRFFLQVFVARFRPASAPALALRVAASRPR